MIRIRECNIDDFSDVLILLRQLWPDKQLDAVLLKAVFNRGMASDCQIYLCAANGERIVGFGSLTLKNSLWQQGYLGHVDELVVESNCRARGIGTQLLARLIEVARQRGCRQVDLDSAFHRQQAHQFYEQNGFRNRAFLFSKTL